MADLRAVPGLRFAGPIGALLAPPYDVIPEQQIPTWQARSPHNVVRLTRPGLDYQGSADRLRRWQADGVLREDPPSMYLHEVRFGDRVRRDLMAGLRLQPYEDGVVLPHERTHRGPKEDRLALLRATAAALEPLWFLYEGAGTGLPELLRQGFATEPTTEFEFEGERHRLWVVGDPVWQQSVSRALAPLPMLIADGHHRYETTLAYSREVGGAIDAASRFTLALLTDIDDEGLVVLPTHRLLKAGVAVAGGEPVESLEAALAGMRGRVAASTYRAGKYQVLPLEGEVAVVELHRQVVDNILGKRSSEDFLTYTRDAAEAVRWVDEGRGVAAFFLAPPELRSVLKLAREGKTMPQKSTYFHPKPPSGMVIYKLDPNRTL